MYEGFGKEWFVNVVAFLAIFWAAKYVTAGFWSFVGVVVLSVILAWISAASLMLLAFFNLPVNLLTVIPVMIATNALTLLITAAVTPINFEGFWQVIWWSIGIGAIRSFLRKGIDFVSNM
jgi:uncharacterized membrane protein YvlD (DUF360 family)